MSASPNPQGDELLAIAERVATQAKKGELIEAYVGRASDTHVRTYAGEVEQLESAQSQGIGVRVVVDGRTGFAYAGTLDADAIADVLAEARDNASFGTPDEFAGLAEPDGVPTADLDLWNDQLASLPTEQKIAMTLELEKLTAASDPRITVESADYSDVLAEGAIASSIGMRGYGRETGCYVMVSTLATQGNETQTGYGYSVGRGAGEIDITKAAADAVDRATRLLGATKPQSGRVNVVFDPMVSAQFLRILSSALNGEAVLKGRSFLADRLGDEIASPLLTLIDDPTDPRAFSATTLDGEGLATRRNMLIDKGVLQMFVHNSYSARRAGTRSTGSAVRGGFKGTPGVGCIALQIAPGAGTQADLVRHAGDGILVQSVSGMHSGVNPVSGDFSTGASGLLIRNGELGGPVREFTIASTIQKMLKDISAVGADVDWLPSGTAGVSLVVRDVTMSGS
ncbi:MAG: TldD/PmbA family protein [Acidimicrobiia bacterium]